MVIHRLGWVHTIVLLGNGGTGWHAGLSECPLHVQSTDRRQDMSTPDHMFAPEFVIAIKDEGYSITHTYPAKRWSLHAVGLGIRPRPAVTCDRRERLELAMDQTAMPDSYSTA